MTSGKGTSTLRRLPLPASLTAPALARSWVRERLDEWDVHELLDDCLLVTSELVTNAVVHGAEPISICACLEPTEVRISVDDSAHDLSVRTVTDELAEGGRGFALVQACCTRLSVEQHEADGKSIVAMWRRR